MVCRTQLILKRTGADLFSLIPGAVVSAWGRRKGGGGELLSQAPPSQVSCPTITSPNPSLRVKRSPGYMECTVMARDQGGHEPGAV